jgi:WD40 repeat protein
MSVCCLNPLCDRPLNPDDTKHCHNCRMPLALLGNHYRPINFLDKGGFGRTFLAENILKFNEPCVIKQLVPLFKDPSAIKKAHELFEQEAKKLQKLGEHPQIPRLTAYFKQDNYWYIVQQFIEGKNLYQELEKEGIFSEEKISKLLLELLEILKFIHRDNVIHRDIKPANIIRRNSDRRLILIDFGIAKELAQTTFQGRSPNSTATAIGTPGYMSPEQLEGGRVSPASDLYNLGVTCFYLLSKVNPYTLSPKQDYSWIANWQQHIKTPISQPLVNLLNKLLQEDCRQRYQNAEEVLADLNFILPNSTNTNEPVKDKPTHPKKQQNIPETLVRSPSIWRRNLPSLLLVLSFLLIVFFGVLYQWLQDKNLQTDSKTASKPIEIQPIKTASEQKPKEQSINPESQKINYLKPKNTQTVNAGFGVNSVAISGNGKMLVGGGASNAIKIWDLKTKTLQATLTGNQSIVTSVAISKDRKMIVSGNSDRTINIWNLETKTLQATLKGHKRIVDSVAISGDGKTLVSGSSDNTIKIWDVGTKTLRYTLTGHQNNVTSVAISSDGKTIASGSSDRTIKIWDIETKTLRYTLTGHNDNVDCVAISNDGKTLVSGSWDNIIKIWNLETGKLQSTLTGHEDNIDSVAISGDGKTIVSGSNDETIRIWDVKTGKLQSTLNKDNNNVTSVAISGDGKTIVSDGISKTIEIWRFEYSNSQTNKAHN